jgi:serine/threonine protein phosphatase PrpC
MSRFDCFAISEQGPEDDVNDDACAVDGELGVFLVADGMGGRPGGARASNVAAQVFMQQMKSLDAAARLSEPRLKEAVARVNLEILSVAASDPLLTGLGTTLSAAVFIGPRGRLVHVGDSRVYLFHGGSLAQLTKDHTLVEELVDRKHLGAEDAATYPLRSMLSRHLGSEAHAQPDILDVALAPGDWLLLATDGVSKGVKVERLAHIVEQQAAGSAEAMCREVIRAVLEHPPDDDVTVAAARLQS